MNRATEVGQVHPEGELTTNPAVSNENFWRNVWNDANGLPAGLPPVTLASLVLRRLVDRLFEALGSNNHPTYFTLL